MSRRDGGTAIGELLDLRAAVADGHRLVERGGELRLLVRLDVGQDQIDVVFQSLDDFLVAFDKDAALFQEKAGPVAADVATRVGQVAAGLQVATAKAEPYNAANVRTEMARKFPALGVFTNVSMPKAGAEMKADMQVVEL